MVTAYGKPVVDEGGGLFAIEVRQNGCYVHMVGRRAVIGCPFDAIGYRCGPSSQCVGCPSNETCEDTPPSVRAMLANRRK